MQTNLSNGFPPIPPFVEDEGQFTQHEQSRDPTSVMQASRSHISARPSDPPVETTSALPQAPLSSQPVHTPKEPSASTVNRSPRRTARIHQKTQPCMPCLPEDQHNVKRNKNDDQAMTTQVSGSQMSNSSDPAVATTTVLPKAPLSVHIQKEPSTSASIRLSTENTNPRRTTRITKPNQPYSPEVENDFKKNKFKKGNNDKEKKK